MTQKEPSGIIALAARAQQIFIYALGEIESAAVCVIPRLPIGYMKKL